MTADRRVRDFQKTDPHLRTHPAFRRFNRALGCDVNTAHGLLCGLWGFAFNHAQDGDLSRFSGEDLCDVLDWDGDGDLLIEALTHAGFLVNGIIHDWNEWGGALFTTRTYESATRQDRRYRQKAREQEEMSGGHPQDKTGLSDQKRREERREEKSKELVALSRSVSEPDDGFDEFWAVFPNRQGKKDAQRHWRRFNHRQRERALSAAQAVAYAVANGYQESRFVPHGSSWLNQERFEDWYDGDEMVVPPNYARQGNGKLQAQVDRIAALAAEIWSTP